MQFSSGILTHDFADLGLGFSLFHLPRPDFFIMLVAVRPPRIGIGRVFGLPTAIMIATGISAGAFLAFRVFFGGVFEYIMVFPL
jgi:hypothetical protein